MKKIIITLITAALTLGAMAQVNAVGIPFGISKVKAVELLTSKYGQYIDYGYNSITYADFRLDCITYNLAQFSFDNNMRFSKAMFFLPKRSLTDTEAATEDMKNLVAELESRYLVVNLVEYGSNQEYKDGNGIMTTLYRALPKNAAQVEHSYMITVLAYADADGIRIAALYEPKDIK